MRRAIRVHLLLALIALGIAMGVSLLPTHVAADTSAGWAAAEHAMRWAGTSAPYADPDGDIRLFLDAWARAGVLFAGADTAILAAQDTTGRVGGGRGDPPVDALATAVCGGGITWTWEVTRAEQPGPGDLVIYRPPPQADGPASRRVGMLVSQTDVVVVADAGAGPRATQVRRELLFHPQQANAGDPHVADSAGQVGFCRVNDTFIPTALRMPPGADGSLRLIDPLQVAATRDWNAAHPRDRDGTTAVTRMLGVFAMLPGAGLGALVGLVIFGGAAIHDGSGGFLGAVTAPFAVLRSALTWTFDGTVLHRVLGAALLTFLGLKLLGMPFAVGLTVGVTVAVAGALELSVGHGFRPFTWLTSAAWALVSYAVTILTGIDDSTHVPGITVGLALLGDLTIVLGGTRLLGVAGPFADLVRTSALGRGVAAVWSRSGATRLLVGLHDSAVGQLLVGAERNIVMFGQNVLGRSAGLLSGKPSAFVPSGNELASGFARLVGDSWAAEVAPRTVAEAVSGARVGITASGLSWATVAGDTYGVGLRALDMASWLSWRRGAITGDLVSMGNELAEWLAGRLAAGDLSHPFVRAVDAMLGHLEPAARRQIVEAALPALRDAAHLGSLHGGGQLAGDVLSGARSLPLPATAPAPSPATGPVGAMGPAPPAFMRPSAAALRPATPR